MTIAPRRATASSRPPAAADGARRAWRDFCIPPAGDGPRSGFKSPGVLPIPGLERVGGTLAAWLGILNPGRVDVKSSVLRTTLGGLCLVVLLLTFSGCDSEDGAPGRLVCEVTSVNGGNPLISAWATEASDGSFYQTIDSVPVTFYARPYGSTVTTPTVSGPYTQFQVTGYDLLWEDVSDRDGLSTVDLPQFDVIGGSTNVLVPMYDTQGGAVLVVGPEMKATTWFSGLGAAPLPPSFQANARLVFYGREVGSDREISFEAGLRVLFVASVLEN